MSREQAVPCRNASLGEVQRGRHMTYEDSAICARCALTGARADGGGGLPSTTPSLSREEQRQLTVDAVERLLLLHES